MTAPDFHAAAAPTSMVAYVSCAQDRQILVFGLDALSGTPTLEQTVSVPGADVASPSNMPLAIDPTCRFLYAALRAPPFQASCFDISPATGHLRWRSSTPLSDPMACIKTDASGAHLLCASYPSGAFAVYPLRPDGGIGPHWTGRIEGQPKAHCIIPGRRPEIVYASVLGADCVLPLAFDALRGTLKLFPQAASLSAAGSGPRHLALHPAVDILYTINELAATLDVRGIDPDTGLLQQVQTLEMMPQGFSGKALAADLHVTPDARYLYASIRSISTIVGYRIDPTSGHLTLIQSWPADASPRAFAISPDSRFLIVAGQLDNAIAVHKITPDGGELTKVASHATAGNPTWVEIIERPPA